MHFCKQILFVIDQCNKSLSKSWDSRGCWNNWQVHIFKIINNKKNMINSIFYLTKYHLHSFFLFKNSMIGMVKNMILYKMWNKKKSAYPKVRGTHINYKVYNFFFYKHIHLTIITIQLQNTSNIGFKLKFLIQLTRQLLSYLIEMLRKS